MTIVSADYMVDESQSSVEVCASLTDIPAGGLECEVVATINTMDGPKASMSQLGYMHMFTIPASKFGQWWQRSMRGQSSLK